MVTKNIRNDEVRPVINPGFSYSEQAILFQRLGVDMDVLRQSLQTTVALTRTPSDSWNVRMKVRTSGRRRLTGANEFLSSRALVRWITAWVLSSLSESN